MKKLLFLLVSLFLGACSNENSPENVATKFVTAIETGNFKEAEKYSDESMTKLLQTFSSMPEMKDLSANANKNPKVKIIKTDIKDDTAKVFYTINDNEKEESIDLKKVDGQWKVYLNKEHGKEGMPDGNLLNPNDSLFSDEDEIDTDSLQIQSDSL